jgi:hypothetical protein
VEPRTHRPNSVRARFACARASTAAERYPRHATTPHGRGHCCADTLDLTAALGHRVRVAHHLPEDTETKGDGATDIMVDSSERRCVPLLLMIDTRLTTERWSDPFLLCVCGACGHRSNSLDERRPAPSRAPFGRGTLLDLSKSAGTSVHHHHHHLMIVEHACRVVPTSRHRGTGASPPPRQT